MDFQFIESLTLTKSTKSGQPEPFRLIPFQRKFIGNLLGWKRPDGRRLHRKAYLSVARKNTKTQLVAALGLDLLVLDEEAQPEIYAAAKTGEQSEKIFMAAADMVNAHEELREMLTVVPYRKEIKNRANGGIFRALSSEGKSKHGSNPSAILIDEFHVWGPPEQELYDALTTGRGARKQPLQVIITTAGLDEQSICYREYDYAKRVLSGLVEDPTYLAMIYEVPKDADWTDESVWSMANPTLGEVVQIDILREDFAKAMAMPSEQTAFRRLYLNQWVNAKSTWIPLTEWDACTWKNSDPIPALAA